MSATVHARTPRTHAKDLHADLQRLRAGSQNVRITVNPSVSRAAVRAAMAATGTSQKQFALTADQPESVVSDALNGRGRHLDTDWILAQGEAFAVAWWDDVKRQMGLTEQTRHEQRWDRVLELVRLLMEGAA